MNDLFLQDIIYLRNALNFSNPEHVEDFKNYVLQMFANKSYADVYKNNEGNVGVKTKWTNQKIDKTSGKIASRLDHTAGSGSSANKDKADRESANRRAATGGYAAKLKRA